MGRRSLSASGNISGKHKLDGRSVNKLKHMRISRTLSVVAARNGRPLHQSSVLRRKLHPVLASWASRNAACTRSVVFATRTCEATRPPLREFVNSGWDMPERVCPTSTTRSEMTCRFVKRWQRKRVWVSSFRSKSALNRSSLGQKSARLDRMDRNARCTIGCKCGIIRQDNSRGVAQPG